MTLDISIQNPYVSLNNGYSVIFSRGGTVTLNPEANSSIKGSVNNYNVAIALAPGNTDLVISVLNSDGNPDNILVPNVPVKEPFRIGVVLLSTVFEVYLNGKLVRTRRYTSGSPGNYAGPFRPPTGNVAKSVKMGNLILWNRIASAGNIRYAKPDLMSVTNTDNDASDLCGTRPLEDPLSTSASSIASSAVASFGSTATTASSAVRNL
jgi:hypothetical protein